MGPAGPEAMANGSCRWLRLFASASKYNCRPKAPVQWEAPGYQALKGMKRPDQGSRWCLGGVCALCRSLGNEDAGHQSTRQQGGFCRTLSDLRGHGTRKRSK